MPFWRTLTGSAPGTSARAGPAATGRRAPRTTAHHYIWGLIGSDGAIHSPAPPPPMDVVRASHIRESSAFRIRREKADGRPPVAERRSRGGPRAPRGGAGRLPDGGNSPYPAPNRGPSPRPPRAFGGAERVGRVPPKPPRFAAVFRGCPKGTERPPPKRRPAGAPMPRERFGAVASEGCRPGPVDRGSAARVRPSGRVKPHNATTGSKKIPYERHVTLGGWCYPPRTPRARGSGLLGVGLIHGCRKAARRR